MHDYIFTLDFQVRDYEVDMQGIVNNAVYQNYLEHTRHEFLKSIDLDFARFARDGINLVVVRAELDYRHPLKSGDRFWVGVRLERVSRLRFAFLQDIFRSPDDRLILNARVIGTAMNAKGRPVLPTELEARLGSSG
jgi:acyl-CoA thioester hydrolase